MFYISLNTSADVHVTLNNISSNEVLYQPVLTDVPSSVTEPVTSVPSSIMEPVTSVPSSIMEPVTSVPSNVTEPVTSVPSSITEPVTSVPSSITEPVTSVPSSITEPVTSVSSSITEPPSTSVPFEPVTSVPSSVHSEPVTSVPLSVPSEPVTSAPLSVPSEPVTIAPLSVPSEPVTSAPPNVQLTPPTLIVSTEISLDNLTPQHNSIERKISTHSDSTLTPPEEPHKDEANTTLTSIGGEFSQQEIDEVSFRELLPSESHRSRQKRIRYSSVSSDTSEIYTVSLCKVSTE